MSGSERGGGADCDGSPDPSAGAPVVEVAAGLVFHQGRVLVAQRPTGKHLAGYWEFPGGKREPGETWEACLGRELLEELGVEIVAQRLVAEVTHDYPGKRVRLRFFAARWVAGAPTPLGCAAWRWATVEDLRRLQFPPADTGIVEMLERMPEMKSELREESPDSKKE